jgi:RNA polymerase sigma-70 factor, ECF subfamily
MNLIENGGRPPTTLEEAFVSAKSVWPRVCLTYQQFHDFVTQVRHDDGLVPAYPADVYLCTGCVHGYGAAYQAMQTAYFPSLRGVIYRVVGEETAVDDVLQNVCARLFVGEAAKLRTYRGSGALGAWLRQVALRASHDYLRQIGAQRVRLRKLAHAEPACAPQPEGDSGLQYATLCEQAWCRAICSLSTEDKQLLHHYFVSGLSIDTLGVMYKVHRATIARRINRVAGRVGQRARKALSRHFPELSTGDLDALVRQSCRSSDLVSTLRAEAS